MLVRKLAVLGAATLLISQAGIAAAAQPVRASNSSPSVVGKRLSANARAVTRTKHDSALGGAGLLLGLLAAGAVVGGIVGVTSGGSDHGVSN